MIHVYWNRAVGIGEDRTEVFQFPNDPERLSEIFLMIRERDFSFLGDFYSRYGPQVVMKGDRGDDLLHEALIMYGIKLIDSMDRNELLIIEAWKFLKDLEKFSNVYKMHMLDWHHIYEPFTRYRLDERALIKDIMEKRSDSVFDAVKRNYSSIGDLQESVESFIRNKMEECCPNLTSIAGPLLGAELISIAGGLKNLAMMPGSRIQILGAGKAFFISKKKSVPGPKHGVIFKHPLVHNSRERGRNARSLACRIAIAARIDYFSRQKNMQFLENSKKILSE
ncbi:MAG: hypothetical protein ACP5LL_03210 [Thermoplasmata archaeon]